MRTQLAALEAEFTRYRKLGEGAMAQLGDEELLRPGPNGGNSIAIIVWHLAGNFASRFTDFLTTDGEKDWRHRDEEFEPRTVSRAALMAKWTHGFDVLFQALAPLTDEDLGRGVVIRGEPWRVDAALYRSVAHTSYHVGQIVYAAKIFRGASWKWLSIAPGQSEAFNQRLSDRNR